MTEFIDVHCHVMPSVFPAKPCGCVSDRWPRVTHETALEATLMLGSKPFRKVDSRSWDVARRLSDMDRDGIAIQVLSPMPELLSYWFDPKDALAMCDHVNGVLAEMVALEPKRFRAFGMVPMQDPDAAATYLKDVKAKFALDGVEIGSNINGTLPGDRKFDGFYAAAEALNLSIFIHALHPMATQGISVHPSFVPMVGFPVDNAMAAASLIYGGLLAQFPRLRIGFSHGGGALAPVLHRLDFGWEVTNGFEGTMATKPSDQAAQFYYDSLTYSKEYLWYLSNTMAPGHIFLGTDYPYVLMQNAPTEFVGSCGFDAENTGILANGAARSFIQSL